LIVFDFGIHRLTVYNSWEPTYLQDQNAADWKDSTYAQEIKVFFSLYTMDGDVLNILHSEMSNVVGTRVPEESR
jgi:hypothetical protein